MRVSILYFSRKYSALIVFDPLLCERIHVLVLFHVFDQIPPLLPDSPHHTEHTDPQFRLFVLIHIEWISVLLTMHAFDLLSVI